METTTTLSIFDRLIGILERIKAGIVKRDQQIDMALQETHKALIETEMYIKDSRADNRNSKKEEELAKLWYAASIPMRYVDNDLAKIMSLKGGYWSNPDSWEDMRSGDADISLRNVSNLMNELFSKSNN